MITKSIFLRLAKLLVFWVVQFLALLPNPRKLLETPFPPVLKYAMKAELLGDVSCQGDTNCVQHHNATKDALGISTKSAAVMPGCESLCAVSHLMMRRITMQKTACSYKNYAKATSGLTGLAASVCIL